MHFNNNKRIIITLQLKIEIRLNCKGLPILFSLGGDNDMQILLKTVCRLYFLSCFSSFICML